MKKVLIFLFLLSVKGFSQQIPPDSTSKWAQQSAVANFPGFGTYMEAKVLQKLQEGITTTNTGSFVITPVTVTTTYSYVTSSGSHTITTGAKIISICNTGGASATFNGGTLPVGACITLPEVLGILHPQITYDCLTSSLIVLIER